MLYSKEQIARLIPQRYPIVQVDAVISAADDTAVTELLVGSDNCFVTSDSLMRENGLIEHIAQSASAFAGHRALASGATNPPVGFIGEVKRFRLHRQPQVGALLRTTIQMGAEVAGITIVTGRTNQVMADGTEEPIAETMLKIFVEDEAKSRAAEQQQEALPREFDGQDFFRILSHTPLDSEGRGSVDVELCPDYRLYAGHFPGRPVSPGVCNIGMIRDCAAHLAGRTFTYADIRQCRLTAIASPQASPRLTVSITLQQIEDKWSVQGVIADSQQTYMELKGTLQ